MTLCLETIEAELSFHIHPPKSEFHAMVKNMQGRIAIPKSVLHIKYVHPARFKSVASAVYRLRVQDANLPSLVAYLLLHPKLQKYFKPRLD